jgi:hypothetical protein
MRLLDRATSSGRYVFLTAYLEGGVRPVVSDVICHSAEQAARLAAELNELRHVEVEPADRRFRTCPVESGERPCEHARGHGGPCSWEEPPGASRGGCQR